MYAQTRGWQSWKGRILRILTVEPNGMGKRMREAIARRAYEIFESRGSSPGYEIEDWRRAESEIVRPLGCGFTMWDEKISLNTDCSVFDEGIVEVCVEPRCLSICGRLRAGKETTPKANRAHMPAERVYQVLNLPVEVDPSHVETQLNGCILQIDLYRAPAAGRKATLNLKAA